MEQGIYYTYRYLQTYNNVAAATETEVFKLLNLVSSEVVEKDGWLIVDSRQKDSKLYNRLDKR